MPNERSTDMKTKNIEDIRESVRGCAEFHGFETEDAKYANLGLKIKSKTECICIDIHMEFGLDFERKIATENFTFVTSICRMGGQNTPEEFRAIADEMLRTADLIEDLNACRYELITEIPTKAQ